MFVILDKVGLEKYLERTNPWWITGRSEKAQGKIPRGNLDPIYRELDLQRIVQIVGSRRAGKSTTIHLIINHLLRQGIDPRRILYVSLDDPLILTCCTIPISDAIEFFFERTGKGPKYVFLDEVQKTKQWYEWVKGYHDRELILKMIISGSSSLTLQKEANTYLRGRLISFIQYPFDLREFLMMDDIEISPPHYLDDGTSMSISYAKVKEPLEKYLRVGGYPEWFQVRHLDNVQLWFDRLYEDVPKKAFYEDVVQIFNIRNPRALEILFAFIAQNQSRILSYESMNQVVGLDRTTLLDYLEFLKSSYLIIEIPVFSEKVSTQEKSMKKYLLSDQGIRNGILKEYVIKEENLGFIVENVVGIYLARFCDSKKLNLNYVRNNGEIDFIVSDQGRAIPVEVKTSDKFKVSQLMKKFVNDKGSPFGVVITQRLAGEFETDGIKVRAIPLWILLLGDIEKEIWI